MGELLHVLSLLLTEKYFYIVTLKKDAGYPAKSRSFYEVSVSGRLQIYPERNNALIVKVLVIKNKEK